MITEEDRKDLQQNGIEKNSVSEKVYEHFRSQGMTHKEAARATVEGVLGLKSESLEKDILEAMKNAILKGSGQWV